MQGQIHVPSLTRINKSLLIAYVATFLFSKIFGQAGGIDLLPVLGLSLEGLSRGFIFEFLTYPFIDLGFTTVLFNALLLWFIGSELELKWGQSLYLKFLLSATLGAALFYLAVFGVGMNSSMPLFGMTGTNLALIMAYGIIYSERTMIFMFLFPMKAKYFCMILAAIEIYMGLFSSNSEAAWSHIAAMVSAFVFLKYLSLRARGVTLSSIKAEHHRNKMKSKLTLIKGDSKPEKPDPDDPKYWQ